jgi:NADP-dependent aldehyde dehydrogenase
MQVRGQERRAIRRAGCWQGVAGTPFAEHEEPLMSSQSVNPRTGDAFGPVIPDTDRATLDRMVDAAAAAAAPWAALSPGARAEALDAVAEALDADAERLAEIADAETGLGLPRLTGEVARTTFQLRMFATALRSGELDGVVVDPAVVGDPPAGHADLRQVLVPLGPVAVYGASNFPFAFSVLGGDTASALAAGCPVVAKAHPSHPQTSQAVADLAVGALASAGAPAGTLALVHGFEAGVALIEHPAIEAGAFTGSTTAGRALFDLAAGRPRPIPFYGELGSVNPVVVLAGAADRPSLAADYLASLTLGAGQFCTNPSLLLVPAGSSLVERVEDLVASLPAGTLLNGNVAALLDRNRGLLEGLPGVRRFRSDAPVGDGFLAAPEVLVTDAANAIAHPELLRVECFGPVGVVVEYGSVEEALEVLETLEGALVGTIHAEVADEGVDQVVAALVRRCGRLVWNGWPTGVAVTAGQHHAGPYPASTSSLHTSVGTAAARRFQRPVAFQGFPTALLPEPLRD